MTTAHFRIREDDLTGADVLALLRDHLDDMYDVTPPGSVHALDVERLRGPGITFWSVWDGTSLVGCGALKALDARSGEVKSMRTARAHRRRGVAACVLAHIVAVARDRGYRTLFLETGAQEAFAPARALYTRHGFEPCGPFADYTDDPNSAFMKRHL